MERMNLNVLTTTFKHANFFTSPPFEGKTVEANFQHIKDLHDLERLKPVKIAYLLNDQCLNPQPVEKTKVSLLLLVSSLKVLVMPCNITLKTRLLPIGKAH